MNKTYCIVTTTSHRACVNVQSYMFYITYLNSSVKHCNECCTAYLRYLTVEATKLRPETWSFFYKLQSSILQLYFKRISPQDFVRVF